MFSQVDFAVAGVPVAKGRPRATVRGGVPSLYTPAKTRTYESLVQKAAQEAMDHREYFDDAVDVSILAYLPIPASWSKKKQRAALHGEVLPTSRPDVDNYAKIICDACNGIVYRDDSLIVGLTVEKRYSDNPRIFVRVSVI